MPDPIDAPRKRGRPRSRKLAIDASPVQALDRGLTVLEVLAKMPGASLSELSRQVNMPPSTVHRILATLQNHSYTEFDPHSQEWAVGIGAFRVGNAYLQRFNLVEAAQVVMRRLMEQTGETANLGIADDAFIVFISQVETQNPIRAMFRAGARSQMHTSGIGKAMLAHMRRPEVEKILKISGQPKFTEHSLITPEALFKDLAEVTRRGWSYDNEERYIGMRCIASAIFNERGAAIAGVSVSGPTARFSEEMIGQTGLLVRQAAADITVLMGGNPDIKGVTES